MQPKNLRFGSVAVVGLVRPVLFPSSPFLYLTMAPLPLPQPQIIGGGGGGEPVSLAIFMAIMIFSALFFCGL
jgi:hypothetical protein